MPKVKASCETLWGAGTGACKRGPAARNPMVVEGGPWVLEPAGEPTAGPAMRHWGTPVLGMRQGRHDAGVGDNCRLKKCVPVRLAATSALARHANAAGARRR